MNKIKVNDEWLVSSKVVCVGRNYSQHVHELGNDIPEDIVVFMKPNSSISHKLNAYHQEALHYEGEICFVIKNGQFDAIGVGLDLTKRILQKQLKDKQLPWERAKSFIGSAVFQNFVSLPEAVDYSMLSIELWINGSLRQKGCVSEMLFQPDVILNELKTFLTLENGDVVMTGTPEGVGEVAVGDMFVGRIFYDQHLLVESNWLAR